VRVFVNAQNVHKVIKRGQTFDMLPGDTVDLTYNPAKNEGQYNFLLYFEEAPSQQLPTEISCEPMNTSTTISEHSNEILNKTDTLENIAVADNNETNVPSNAVVQASQDQPEQTSSTLQIPEESVGENKESEETQNVVSTSTLLYPPSSASVSSLSQLLYFPAKPSNSL